MTDTPRLSRRALLAGVGAGLFATPALAAGGHDHAGHDAPKPKKAKAARAAKTPPPAGTPLVFPRLVDLGPGETFDLVAEPATHAFLKDKPVAVVGYGGTYMGPALRLKRGVDARIRLVNRLDRPTNVHWHGALVDARLDGATLPGLATGAAWETKLRLDQPAATLWYHAHVHGTTARDVHDGLCGLMIVDDPAAAPAGLPATWGVDDLPLILQDRTFDDTGAPRLPPLAETLEHGFRGRTMIVNGIADALATVPPRLVRLRLLNAAGARTFRLAFEDRRSFRLIAGDGGFLPAAVPLDFLALAPGERAEILVDFAEGASPLLTLPDDHEHRDAGRAMTVPDVVDVAVPVLAFDVVRDERAAAPSPAVPERLATLPALPASTLGLTRRRFELRVAPAAADAHAVHDHTAMMHGTGTGTHATADAPPAARLSINGKPFAMGRIDETVKLGATEIWEIVSPDMAHPFHVHGAHFRVLAEGGRGPKSWNGGVKDTVLVEDSAELLVTFTRRADADAPFLYHCHLLEHEDGGMMGTFTVG